MYPLVEGASVAELQYSTFVKALVKKGTSYFAFVAGSLNVYLPNKSIR